MTKARPKNKKSAGLKLIPMLIILFPSSTNLAPLQHFMKFSRPRRVVITKNKILSITKKIPAVVSSEIIIPSANVMVCLLL